MKYILIKTFFFIIIETTLFANNKNIYSKDENIIIEPCTNGNKEIKETKEKMQESSTVYYGNCKDSRVILYEQIMKENKQSIPLSK